MAGTAECNSENDKEQCIQESVWLLEVLCFCDKVISLLALKGFRLRAMQFHTQTYQLKTVPGFSTQWPARPNAKLLAAECQYIIGVVMA